jgi:hypothetical protein
MFKWKGLSIVCEEITVSKGKTSSGLLASLQPQRNNRHSPLRLNSNQHKT